MQVNVTIHKPLKKKNSCGFWAWANFQDLVYPLKIFAADSNPLQCKALFI